MEVLKLLDCGKLKKDLNKSLTVKTAEENFHLIMRKVIIT